MPRRATSTSYGAKQGNKPKGSNPRRPGPGVLPEAFKERMRTMASRQATYKRLEEQLQSEDDRVFLDAFRECANRGYGKAPESVEVNTKGTLTIRLVDE